MKYWWRNVVNDYFTFSAKERNGLIIMGLIGALIFIFSRYFTVKEASVSKDAFQQELAQLKIIVDSSNNKAGYQRDENYVDYYRPMQNENVRYSKGVLFEFDPNTLDADGWKKLGVREKTINTIQKFLASGYKFRKPDDIRKIYGLQTEDAGRLIPYIRIAKKEESSANNSYADKAKIASTSNAVSEIKRTKIIDINTADTSEFISLPGIGSKLATRIVNFRQKLGGFSSVAQLGETYGIADSTFEKIKSRLQCINPILKTININTAGIDELRAHPYLRWNIANAILNYRQQHGNYISVEDIKKIDIITEELYNKIAPYLVVRG
ncbi:ComEA family DNA-binding protein [Segetibacter koreensis]|uniref:ComEA family DNA-binding protein n=1 Tax=Segetibacter koreensis TaxID=398037 RepID=UPI00036ADDDE|nr:helix-hairpin-helix domain-containing protein [Segetibacter koreensis]